MGERERGRGVAACATVSGGRAAQPGSPESYCEKLHTVFSLPGWPVREREVVGHRAVNYGTGREKSQAGVGGEGAKGGGGLLFLHGLPAGRSAAA